MMKKMNRVLLVSLGCDKNTVDAERMAFMLESAGFVLVDSMADADCALINTCGFIENAKKEAIEAIFSAVREKDAGNLSAVVVTGCLAQRYTDELKAEIPELDAVVTLANSVDIAAVVERALNGEKTFCPVASPAPLLEGERLVSTPKHYAYIKIADGCDNRCTFCAIPGIRGGYISRRHQNVLAEARALADRGVRELILIAQDTTRYADGDYGICELIRDLSEIDGVEWIRLLYAYPDGISEKLVNEFKKNKKLLPYIDIPLQHCNADVLKRMGRHITDKNEIQRILNSLTAAVSGFAVRTTFIAGFPGESEEQFEQLCEFAKANGFARAGCFAYSQEEDTPAARLSGQLDEQTKQRRADALNLLLYEQLLSRQLAAVGSRVRAICDGFDGERNKLVFRSIYDAPDVDTLIFVEPDEITEPGDIVTLQIISADGPDLAGEIDSTDGE